jgi:hypothetical protein
MDVDPGDPPPPWSLAEADPELAGVIEHGAGAADGYTLIAPLNDTATFLLDMRGEVVHAWQHDSSPAGGNYLLEDGTLLRCGREDEDPKFRGGGIGGRIQKLAPDGTLLWDWSLADDERCQHHDIQPLPNGNVLVIAWERKSAAEAIARGRHPHHVGAAGLWSDMLLEVKPVLPDGGEIVWEWHAWDHLIQDLDPALPAHGEISTDPGRLDVNFDHRDAPPPTAEELEAQRLLEEQMAALGYAGGDEDEEEPEPGDSKWDRSGDWLHTNAVDFHPGEDLIVLSSPRLSEVFVIDHSTTTAEAASGRGGRRGQGGRILWRWGNPRNHGHGEESDQLLLYQHNPTWLDGEVPGELRLLVFNNGSFDDKRRHSSVEELVLPFDPESGFEREPDAAFGPAEPAWSYSDGEDFFSAFISGAQRLPNGNTLVCSGAPGRVFEVTGAGEVVWDYRNRLGGSVTPPDHAGNGVQERTASRARVAQLEPAQRLSMRESSSRKDPSCLSEMSKPMLVTSAKSSAGASRTVRPRQTGVNSEGSNARSTHSPGTVGNAAWYDTPSPMARVRRRSLYVLPSPRKRSTTALAPVRSRSRSRERTEAKPPLFSSDTRPVNAAVPSPVRSRRLEERPPITTSSTARQRPASFGAEKSTTMSAGCTGIWTSK